MMGLHKINLKNGTATGMYLFAEQNEIKLDKFGNTQAPTGRAYKIQVEVEAICNNKRCRGKKSYSIPSGTSMVSAVQSLIGKKIELKNILSTHGTLKKEKPVIVDVDNKSDIFSDCWNSYYNTRVLTNKIRKSTYELYKFRFEKFLKPLHKKKISTIKIADIQEIINNMLMEHKSASTISLIKAITKPVLDFNDVILNWRKLSEPEVDNKRSYTKSKEDTVRIINAMRNYSHPEIRSIFEFLLTGRRIGEVTSLRYENINLKNNTYTISKESVKTGIDLTFSLSPKLIAAIGTIKPKGKVFKITSKWVLAKFKELMATMGIYDLVLHDVRSMVAQTAINNGADIYNVSAMLAHSNVRTTEKSYVDKNKNHADKALDTFQKATSFDIFDVEVVEDKANIIKNMFPNAGDDVIRYVLDVLEANKINSL